MAYNSLFVGSNGYLTFGTGNSDYTETLEDHFSEPRISALFDDLSPQDGGPVSWRQLVDRTVVTWEDVPEYSTSNTNTFQIEMFYDGRIRLSWMDIGSRNNIVGLSDGQGLPEDFEETDFSVRYAQP